MKNYTFLIILTFNSLFSQNSLEGTIRDYESKTPIKYVNIGIKNHNIGTVSNDKGKFNLTIPDSLLKYDFTFSVLGYETKSIPTSKLLDSNNIIELNPMVTELNEVIVTNKNSKIKTLGNKSESKFLRGGFRNSELGNEVGTIIKLNNHQTNIIKFNTFITSNNGEKLKFRLNFYDVKNGYPNKKLFNEEIIFEIKQKEGEFSLNLEEYNLWTKNDIFVSIELIDKSFSENHEVFFSTGFLGGSTLTRHTSQSDWEKLKGISIGFNLTVRKYPNF